jgi:hypothetical protein
VVLYQFRSAELGYCSGKLMRAELENLKNVTILDQMLTMKSALHDEAALDAFVEAVNA